MPGSFSPIFEGFRARRRNLGLSQTDAARRAGITQTYLSKIEQGKVEPRLHTLEDIARALSLELTLIPVEAKPTVQSLFEKFDVPKPLFVAEPD